MCVTNIKIYRNILFGLAYVQKGASYYGLQRAVLCAGVELVFRPPGTAADRKYFDEVKNYSSALLVQPELKLINDLPPIVLPSAQLL